ncbi:prepilin-type N-terminal cleavage/methylation domain-containing protein [Alkaliphilus pronyensis]|uniref:prepilin-type N-terminal cleavage/methylation domain-containing protein n=1 Tax=Alkaliphilus pronyensis TaxID=1482732 RepID=UPI00186583FD|nr:prepilin-type N-terminal cleavage/methylation domain-containing protein [Alkaliphilus pronyensis]
MFRYDFNIKKTSGFTLIEIIIAITIIGIISVSIPPVFAFVARSNEYNRISFTAANLANEKMEYIRSLSFAEIGTVGGNPSGTLEMTEAKEINGRSYTIQTIVNWVEEGDCSAGGSADWDYKSIRVIATSTATASGINVSKELESLIARDSEQPAFTGSNLRVCVFRGWNPSFDPLNPVYVGPVKDVSVSIIGPSIATVISNHKGSALFLDINNGTYDVEVDAGFLNMIVLPNTFPKEIEITDGNTTQEFAFVEYPCRLSIKLIDLDTKNPIVLNEESFSGGQLTLNHPYDNIWVKTFNSTDSMGLLPNDLFSGLWPVGAGYSGLYSFDDINIPGYIPSQKPVWDADKDEEWMGDFEAPDTTKNLKLLIIPLPLPSDTTVESLDENWTMADSVNITANNPLKDGIAYYTEDDIKYLTDSIFSTNHPADKLVLAGGSPQYTAGGLFFTNSKLEVSSHSNLRLKANNVVIKGQVEIHKHSHPDNDGKLTLNIINGDIESSFGTIAVNQFIIEELKDGSELEDGNGNKGISGRQYGKVYFASDVLLDDTLLIEKGAYYFPDGFQLPTDASKSPQEGGLISR